MLQSQYDAELLHSEPVKNERVLLVYGRKKGIKGAQPEKNKYVNYIFKVGVSLHWMNSRDGKLTYDMLILSSLHSTCTVQSVYLPFLAKISICKYKQHVS